jgi:hypothetical protein
MNSKLSKSTIWLFTILMAVSPISHAQNKDTSSTGEISSNPTAEKQADDQRNSATVSGKDHKVSVIVPIFSQALMYSFPKGFTAISQQVNDTQYLHESVLAGETGEKWTQMITVAGTKGAASNPELTPNRYMSVFARMFMQSCPGSFAGTKLGDLSVDGHEAIVVVISCGLVKQTRIPPYSESTLVIAIKGKSDYYTLQWAERASPSPSPMKLDEAKWHARLNSFGPIKLCTNVPGSTSTYTNCISKQ